MLNKRKIYIDFETTGVDPYRARVIQIGAFTRFEGVEYTYMAYINPGIHIPPSSTKIHGITNSKVQTSPTFRQGIMMFIDWVKKYKQNNDSISLVTYNGFRYDFIILLHEMQMCDLPLYALLKSNGISIFEDTYVFMKKMYPTELVPRRKNGVPTYTLSRIYEATFNEKFADAHDALADTKALYRLCQHDIYTAHANTFQFHLKSIETYIGDFLGVMSHKKKKIMLTIPKKVRALIQKKHSLSRKRARCDFSAIQVKNKKQNLYGQFTAK